MMKNTPLVVSVIAACCAASSCTVDFDGYQYDDAAFEEANRGGAAGDGDETEDTDTDTSGEENSAFCVDFCNESATHCPFGEENSYKDEHYCLDNCRGFDDTQIECRLVEVGLAEDDPETHCPNTLLDGGDTCPDATPDVCDTFCSDSASICPFGTELGYENATQCLELCEDYSNAQLECRVVHLNFAREDAATHCAHTLLNGAGVCEDATPDPCATFCADSEEICPFGEAPSYENLEQCQELCGEFTESQLDCRVVHLAFAEEGSPETHCPHTWLDGGGTCEDATP